MLEKGYRKVMGSNSILRLSEYFAKYMRCAKFCLAHCSWRKARIMSLNHVFGGSEAINEATKLRESVV